MLVLKELKKLMCGGIILALIIPALVYAAYRIYLIRDSFAYSSQKKFYASNTANYERADYESIKEESERLSAMFFSGNRTKEVRETQYVYARAVRNLEYLRSYNDEMRSYVTRLEKEYLLEKSRNGGESIKTALLKKQVRYYNKKRGLKYLDADACRDFFFFFHRNDLNPVISFMMLALTVIATAYLFFGDRLFGTREMIFQTVNGRKRLCAARLSSLLVFIVMLCLAEFTAELLIIVRFYGIKEFGAAIQSVSEYEYMPFGITVLGYVLICCLLRMCVLIFAAGICLLFGTMAGNPLRPLFLGAFVNIAIPYFYMDRYLNAKNAGFETIKKTDMIRSFCPFCLLVPDYYFKGFDTTVLFGLNIFRFILPLIICFAVFICGAAVNMFFYRKE